jgi:hypothetical protein
VISVDRVVPANTFSPTLVIHLRVSRLYTTHSAALFNILVRLDDADAAVYNVVVRKKAFLALG